MKKKATENKKRFLNGFILGVSVCGCIAIVLLALLWILT